jgi:hypothetical protein
MSQLFTNMLPYQAALFILGSIIAIGVILAFFISIVKQKPFRKQNIIMLLLSMVMIAWPSIRSVAYGDIKIETINQITEAQKNPTDTASLKIVEEGIKRLSADEHFQDDPAAKSIVARGHVLLGNYEKAKELIADVEKTNPAEVTQGLKDTIDIRMEAEAKFRTGINKINNLLIQYSTAAAQEKDTLAKTVAEEIVKLPHPHFIDEKSAAVLSGALKVTGNEVQSQMLAEKANAPLNISTPEVRKEEDAVVQNKIIPAEQIQPATNIYPTDQLKVLNWSEKNKAIVKANTIKH